MGQSLVTSRSVDFRSAALTHFSGHYSTIRGTQYDIQNNSIYDLKSLDNNRILNSVIFFKQNF